MATIGRMRFGLTGSLAAIVVALLIFAPPSPHGIHAASEGQLAWAVHISIASMWFDPGEHPGTITPMMTYYALHDALVKPMPGKAMAPSLAESWTTSKDGLTYEFVLRKNVKFHNGDPMTAEDVKFSFERYKGAAAKLLKERVAAVEIADPYRVRFRLKSPWPDFMTFFGTPATGAAWVLPKAYIEKVGDEGFKKAPVGTGPYKLVSHTPGVELVFEAHDGFWRKTPAVKRFVWRIVPDESTRLAMLKRGEVDIAYSVRGPLAEEVKRTPGLRLAPSLTSATFWVDFLAAPWEPNSPWRDQRVRLAASLAIDRKAINQAETLGYSKVSASIIPAGYDFSWAAPPIPFDPARARKLLAEAGHPNGFDAGDFTMDISYANLGETVANYLNAVGIRTRIRTLERAAWTSQWREKKIKGGFLQGSAGGFGNAATRIENYVTGQGAFSSGSVPEIDDLFHQQAREADRKRREALLHQIQKIMYDRALFVPIWELAFLNGVGPRVEEAGIGLIEYQPYTCPYEDLRLKKS